MANAHRLAFEQERKQLETRAHHLAFKQEKKPPEVEAYHLAFVEPPEAKVIEQGKKQLKGKGHSSAMEQEKDRIKLGVGVVKELQLPQVGQRMASFEHSVAAYLSVIRRMMFDRGMYGMPKNYLVYLAFDQVD